MNWIVVYIKLELKGIESTTPLSPLFQLYSIKMFQMM